MPEQPDNNLQIPSSDEPCWCGSGQLYQICHQTIDRSPTEHRLRDARALYAKMWDASSRNIENQKGYGWMASIIAPYNPKRILDVGCGNGSGVAALLDRFPFSRVVSLEENPELVAMAKDRLQKAGKVVNVIERMQDKATGPRSHRLTLVPGKLKIRRGFGSADLIESDILEDYEFDKFLGTEKKFDAITVWLIGSHLLRYHECDSHRGKINSPDQYRGEIHAVAFALAARFLRPGGALQIVDRGHAPDTPEKASRVRKLHELLAAATRGVMAVKALDYLPYEEVNEPDTVKMMDSFGKKVESPDLSLISVISEKIQKR